MSSWSKCFLKDLNPNMHIMKHKHDYLSMTHSGLHKLWKNWQNIKDSIHGGWCHCRLCGVTIREGLPSQQRPTKGRKRPNNGYQKQGNHVSNQSTSNSQSTQRWRGQAQKGCVNYQNTKRVLMLLTGNFQVLLEMGSRCCLKLNLFTKKLQKQNCKATCNAISRHWKRSL